MPQRGKRRSRADVALLERLLRLGRESADTPDERTEALVLREALLPARVDLLRDDRVLEEREDVIEEDVREIAARFLRVAKDRFLAREGSFSGRRAERDALQELVVAVLDPVRERRAEVDQRIADGRHLPIEDAHDPIELGAQHEDVVL